MVPDYRKKLSDLIHLRTDRDLDGVPLYATRNGDGNFRSLGHRDLGYAARFRAICHGHGKPVASYRANFYGRAGHYGPCACRGHGGGEAR